MFETRSLPIGPNPSDEERTYEPVYPIGALLSREGCQPMMIAPNSRATQIVSVAVLGGITACGMYFNARYAAKLGHTIDEKAVLVAVSMAFDAAKVLAFCYACHHLLRLSFLRAGLAGVIWLLTATYAMYSAGSYTFGQLASAQLHIEQDNRELTQRADKIKRLEGEVETAKLAKNSKGANIWESSGSCLTPTTPESISFCNAYLVRLGTLNEFKAEAAKDSRAIKQTSPEIAEWSRLTGLTPHEVMVGISLIFALIMEVVASVSGFAFAKNARDIQDEVDAEIRRKKHETRMAQLQMLRDRAERRNEQRRQRRAEVRSRPALKVVQ